MPGLLDSIKSGVSGQNTDTESTASGAQENPFELGSGRSNLNDFLNRRYGDTEAKAEPSGTNALDFKAQMEAMQAKFEQDSQLLRDQNKAFQDQMERQNKLFEQVANRPVNVQMPQPQQQQQLPSLELDDPDLAAAFNTMDARVKQQLQGVIGQFEAKLNQVTSAQQSREFDHALKGLMAREGASSLFDEKELRANASAMMKAYPGQHINWDGELDLAYNARVAPTQSEELKRLRAFEKETLAKQEREKQKQKQNLNQVSSLGGRGGSNSGQGLPADGILADARKRGKKLSWQQFGSEFMRRRG